MSKANMFFILNLRGDEKIKNNVFTVKWLKVEDNSLVKINIKQEQLQVQEM